MDISITTEIILKIGPILDDRLKEKILKLWKGALSIGPILDDRLKEKILKPWKGAHSSHSVCPSVCLCVNTLQDTLFQLGT